MKKHTVFLLAAFAILISVAAYNANAADNVSSITDICDINSADNNESWSNGQYPVIDLFGEKEVPLFTANGNIGNAHVNKLAKLILDDNNTYSLIHGTKLDLGNGYTLEAKQINVDNEETRFEFSKNGKHIADQIVSANTNSNKTWTVTLDNVQGENNIVVMKVHIKNISMGRVDKIVWIDGIWLTDYTNATTLKVGDKIGEFTLEKIVNGTDEPDLGGLVFESSVNNSSVTCNVTGTDYKCDSWSNNVAVDTTNTGETVNTEDDLSDITSVCNVVGTNYKWGPNEQYPVIDLFGEKEVPLFTTNGSISDVHVNKLAKLIIDSNEPHTLKEGEKLDLGNGYALEAKQIYFWKVWLELTKDGQYIADQTVSYYDGNKTWTVALDNVQGENNITVMRVHVDSVEKVYNDNIFIGMEDVDESVDIRMVQIDGIWLTDYANATTLKIGDEVGEFTLERIVNGTNSSNQGSLVFKNATGSPVTCNVVGTSYECDKYPLINLFGEKQVPLLVGDDSPWRSRNNPIWQCHVDKISMLVLDSDEKHLLKTGEKLELGQGYSLQVKQIDVDGERAWVEFDKDGKYVDDIILLNDEIWTCLRDNIQGENSIPVLKVYVSDVYQDGNDSIVQIDGIWLIDYVNARTLKIGDKVGEHTLEKIVRGTNSSNLGSLAFNESQAVNSSSPAPEEEPAVSTNKSTDLSASWHLNFLKFITSKFLDNEEPTSTKALNTAV